MFKTALAVSAFGAMSSWAYVRHMQLPLGPNRMDWSMTVFGHRGCRLNDDAPENTLSAFRHAINNAASGVELDVRLCKTGELVVFHDGFAGPIFETEAPRRLILDMTLDELRAMRYTCDPSKLVVIPTLKEAIDLCEDADVKMLIEIKHFGRHRMQECLDRVADAYRERPGYMYRNTMVISFNPFALYSLRRRDTGIAVCVLHQDNLIRGLMESNVESFPIAVRICPPLVDWVIDSVLTGVAPWLIGASAVGTDRKKYTGAMHQKWYKRRTLLYLWGFASRDDVTSKDMLASGVSVCTDGNHGDLFAQPRRAVTKLAAVDVNATDK
jgi:glycerophosphoryl diester phosphodiesterase